MGGFGDEGSRAHWWSCFPNLSLYESCYESYAALVGRALDADVHVEAWSGKGITRNAADFWTPTMPEYWKATIATKTTSTSPGVPWDFDAWVPNVLIVYLGSNDFATWPHPSADKFVPRYVSMLDAMAASYAQTKPPMLLLCGGHDSMDNDPCPLVQQAQAEFAHAHPELTVRFVSLKDAVDYPADFGCIAHRNAAGHAKLAKLLLPHIHDVLNLS